MMMFEILVLQQLYKLSDGRVDQSRGRRLPARSIPALRTVCFIVGVSFPLRFLLQAAKKIDQEAKPPGPPRKRRRGKDSRLNPTSWQHGSRRRCIGCRKRTCSDSRTACTTAGSSTSRHATRDSRIHHRSPKRSRPRAHLDSHGASNPPPTPVRSRVHRVTRTHSTNTTPPESSCPRSNRSSHHPTKCSNRSGTPSSCPPEPRTATPTRSTTDTPRPSSATASQRTPWHRPNSHR